MRSATRPDAVAGGARRTGICLLALVAVVGAGCSHDESNVEPPPAAPRAQPELTIIDGDGALPESVVAAFVETDACPVTVERLAGVAAIAARLEQTASVVIARAETIAELGRSNALLELDQLPDGLPSELRDAVALRRDGRALAVPLAFGPDGVVYLPGRTDEPDGLAALYEPDRRGRIAVPDSAFQLATAAFALGLPDPYDLSRDELDAASRLASMQRQSIRAYASSDGALVSLFARNEIDIAYGRRSTLRALASAGLSGRLRLPTGPVPGWLIAAAKGTRAGAGGCADRLLAFLASESNSAAIADRVAGIPALTTACRGLPASHCSDGGVGVNDLLGRLRFTQLPAAGTTLVDWREAWARVRG